MNESHRVVEVVNADELVSAVEQMREFALTSLERNNKWIDAVHDWDKGFKQRPYEKFGTDTKFHQQVPSWQILVGGSVEEEVDITDEARNFILKEISAACKKIKQEIESV